jgi:alkanesulfonate monooxygenase SsuD/methylene tetrahydromethanopterin reductase-like flavin-dependent oxidoreductase (luciferase family)
LGILDKSEFNVATDSNSTTDGVEKSMKFSSFHLFNKPENMAPKAVYDYHIELVEYLEELGFDGVWLAEHHFRDYGVCPDTLGMLMHLAGRTERIRLGTGVSILPLHNPVSIAESAAQLDLLSNGRLDFGVGRGYQSSEFERFGINITEARQRYNEALDMIIGLWTQPDFSYSGEFYQCENLNLVPTPLQSPHPPIHVASISPETIELCAQRGLPILIDPVATFKNVGKAAHNWREAMSGQGNDPAQHDLCVMRSVYIAETNEQAKADLTKFELGFDRSKIVNKQSAPVDSKTGEIAEGFEFWQNRYMKGGSVSDDFRWDQLEIAGDPERVINQVKALQSFGIDNLMCDFGSTRPMPIAELKRIIKFFADEVMPVFAQ